MKKEEKAFDFWSWLLLAVCLSTCCYAVYLDTDSRNNLREIEEMVRNND